MKPFKTFFGPKIVYCFLFLLLGCETDEPYYGTTDEKVVGFWNKTKNQYRVSMVKNNVILKTLFLDSQIKKKDSYYYHNKPEFSVDLNSDSTVYFFDNLATSLRSEVVIYYAWNRNAYYKPENSVRIKVLSLRSTLPEKLELDSTRIFSDSEYNFYPLILTIE